jgi:multiple RNA-binding domain-containing protein 1
LTDFQRKKQERLKADAKKESSWNSLFMSQDAIADAMANKLSVQKGELLDADQGDLAVRMALAETHIIQETTEFLKEHGVSVDAFKANMKKERSDTVILVKNIPFRTSEHELHELFSRCGDIIRLVLPPTRTIALVEYSNGNEVKAAFSQLAFKNFHGKPLLLEKAPIGVFTCKAAPKEEKNEADETVATEPTTPLSDSAAVSLFVKNLSFETKKEALAELFSRVHGFRSAVISTKKDAKSGNILSMGFGFVEYDNIEHANQAIKLFQNTLLDGHALQIKLSDRKSSSADKSSQDSGKEIKAKSSKLLIRNVPFEATKKDLMTLFGSFGQIKRLRMPKKYDNKTHRGFAFVDYLTKQEAKLAFENLSSTHLYGRHLVIEWAEDDESVDAIRDKTRKLFNADAPSAKRKFEFLEGDNNNQDELEE